VSGGLAGKVILVTGAAGGIGAEAVRRLAAEGVAVAGLDCDGGGLRALASSLALALPAPAQEPAAVEEAFRELQDRLGRLDGLLHAVGASGRSRGDGPVDTCPPAAWDWVQETNLRSAYLCTRAAIPLLRAAGGGSIVLVASVLGLAGHPLFATHAYAAAKGGLLALARAMAVTYAPERIRVNALCPGLIRTPMSARAQGDAAVLAELPRMQPLTGTLGEPRDVAAAALFLLSDESRFITGTVLPVDGGWAAQ
jgi:meso-butanediol dehydrogenase/(S,S)-butanediol dehydrogenase/diacetyl reductase